jgi:hypothetical protein
MPTACNYTIETYLRGKVRNLNVTDDALQSILAELEIADGSEYSSLSQKQKDLALAGLYAWIWTSPTQSAKVSDEDGDWSHSEGGEQMSASSLNRYMRMANNIYKKYDMPLLGSNRWGFKGTGFRKIRRYQK